MTLPIPPSLPFEKNILPDILMLYAGTNLGLSAWSLQLEHKMMWGTMRRELTTEEAYEQVAREARIVVTGITLKNKILTLDITFDYEHEKK